MNNKIVLISGVSGGIGQCLAENFLRKGVRVIGLDIVESFLPIDYFCCDIGNEIQVLSTFTLISKRYNHIDALINTAGIIADKQIYTLENLPYEEWKSVLKTNLDGTFLVTKQAIPLLRNARNGASIVSISSEQVTCPTEGSAPYAISKAGVEMMTKILATELLYSNIRVNAIAAASVNNHFISKLIRDPERFEQMMAKRSKQMPFGMLEVDDVFRAVAFLIDEDNKMTGQTVLIDSGYILRKRGE